MRTTLAAVLLLSLAACQTLVPRCSRFLARYLSARHFTSVTLLLPRDGPRGEVTRVAAAWSRAGTRVALSDTPSAGSASAVNVLEFSNGTKRFATHILTKANESHQFRLGTHWLIMTDAESVRALLDVLAKLSSYVDSDVIVGLVGSQGNILLQEVYVTGLGGEQRVINVGDWGENSKSRVSIRSHLNLSGLLKYKFKRRQDLHGLNLRVAAVAVNKMYFRSVQDNRNKTQVIGGYAGDIFLALQNALNFTSSVYVLPGYAYGLYTKENDSWSGLVGELQRGTADISGCEVSPTPERHRHLHFSQPIQIIGRRLYYKRPEKEFHADTFVRPFSGDTWAVLVASLPVLAGVAFLLGALSPERPRHQPVDSYANHVFGLLSALLLQGWPGMYSDTPRRALVWTAYVTYLVVSVSYSAKMVSLRTAEQPSLPIRSLADVLEKPDWDLGFVGAALERNYFQSAEPDSLLGRLWKGWVLRDPGRNLVPDTTSGLQRALDSKFVFLGLHWACLEALQTHFSPHQACQLQILGEDYFRGGISFGLTKHSPLRELVDYRLQLMRQAGVLHRMAGQSLPVAPQCPEPPFSRINLVDVAPALMLLGCGAAASLVILVLEVIWTRRKSRNKLTP